jgi:hypothetical protein
MEWRAPVTGAEDPKTARLREIEQQVRGLNDESATARERLDAIDVKLDTAEKSKRLEVLRSSIGMLAGLAGIIMAVIAWMQSVSTEGRQVSTDLISRFDSDEMWKARLTLQRYYYAMSGDQIGPTELAKRTEAHYNDFVYQKLGATSGEQLPAQIKDETSREKREDYFRQLDQGRRRVKNFHEDLMVFADKRLITEAVSNKLFAGRFRSTPDFLECFWLPVELGQNAALYRSKKGGKDEGACKVIDWYRRKFNQSGKPCVTNADRRPESCPL